MKTFVTGANGFIGSKLCERLLHSGHDVRGLVRASSDLTFLANIPIQRYFGDITRPETLTEPMRDVDVVFHVAGLASDWGSLQLFRQMNVEGTLNVLEAARQAKVRKVVHVSSVAVMGFGRTNVTEEMPPLPTKFAYVLSKLEGERAALDFARQHNLPLTVIRPGDVYGPHDRTWMLPMLTQMDRGNAGHINGGRAELAPVYVDNLVQGLILAAETGKGDGDVFFITDGIRITWKEITAKLCRLMDLPEPKLSVPYGVGYAAALGLELLYKLARSTKAPLLTTYRVTRGGKDFHFSIERAQRILGYQPDQDIDKHLQATVAWYQEYKKSRAVVNA